MAVGPSEFETPFNSAIGGLVLAGGRSTRFGSEKAAALFRGRPLLDFALDHLSAIADPIAVSAARGSRAEAVARARSLSVLHDNPGDTRGPLVGLRMGLQWANARKLDFLAVEPCDAPLLPADLHAKLRAGIGEAPAAFVETHEGVQPLCALWRTSALRAVEAALSGGQHPPIWRLLRDIGAVPLRFSDPKAFINANRPEDIEAAAS